MLSNVLVPVRDLVSVNLNVRYDSLSTFRALQPRTGLIAIVHAEVGLLCSCYIPTHPS